MYTAQTKTATITGLSNTGTSVTYTAANTFVVGDVVHISGISPSNFNIPDAVITARNSTTFTVASTETGTYVSGGIAVYDELKNHLISSPTVKVNTLVLAEWNLNSADNISAIGNYRHRPSVASPTEANFGIPKNEWTVETSSSATKYYYGATDVDIVVDAGLEEDDTPFFVASTDEKVKMLFSLEDCFGKNRPRSGINKLMNFKGRKINFTDKNMALRPRYYAASRTDSFKYWCSYREENVSNNLVTRGISEAVGSNFYIDDTAPFVVYTEEVPANRVVVKMQTHVGSFEAYSGDPFYGTSNKMVPKDWRIEKLKLDNTWEILIDNLDADDIDVDGYVEIEYGSDIPQSATSAWTDEQFVYVSDYANDSDLPVSSILGYGYLVGASESTEGTWYVWDGSSYEQISANYSWRLHNETINRHTPLATDLTNPSYYDDGSGRVYREIDFIKGLRIVVSKMNKANATFDLIELSPRLAVNLSDKTTAFSVTKHASDLGNGGIPVGQLLAGTGQLSLFDYDQAFNTNNVFDYDANTGSIINKFIAKNLQVKMYEITRSVNSLDYYLPIKTMFVSGFPDYSVVDRTVTLEMRDQFIMFESLNAPEVFITDTSLSYAISILLDSVGFSNYIFKRVSGESDPIIPYFYIPPQTSVAQVLQGLAVSTQHMMFFDEYNNFVVMSKNYSMPNEDQRSTDFVLYGSQDYTTSSELNIKERNTKLANIMGVSSKVSDIYNDGKITYSIKDIQRENTIAQKSEVDKGRSWIYKAALLWEAPPPDATKSFNFENTGQSGYSLAAIPLNTDLTDNLPKHVATAQTLTATLTLGAKTVTVTSTANLAIGQTLTKTSGTGFFGSNSVQIVSIDSATQVTVNLAHVVAGSITFTANSGTFNNVIDLGDAAYWLPRYNGYFYANGEVIKYDAVEYMVQGTGAVWISNVTEYQTYFASLPFNKKIYPTGRIRIYTKVDPNGNLVKHGRGQFGTEIVLHPSGVASHWKNTDYMKGLTMRADLIFDEKNFSGTTELGAAGKGAGGSANTDLARSSAKVSQTIKNVLITKTSTPVPDTNIVQDSYTTSSVNPSVQSSALILTGPSKKVLDKNKIKGKNFITYINKPLLNKFTHFGTRLRIVGKPGSSDFASKTELENPEQYYQNNKIPGGAAGLAFMLDSSTNNGYYFEIVASPAFDVNDGDIPVNNIFFYKIKKNSTNSEAIPVLLWSGATQVLPDRGEFAGQSRVYAEQYQTIFDLAVEYEVTGKKSKMFYLYVNGNVVKQYEDKDSLPVKKNIALFVRGSTKAMFENVYALSKNYSFNGGDKVIVKPPAQSVTVFDDTSITSDEALSKYAISGMIKSTLLSSIGSSGTKYSIYFDEFGTIMRECDYFDIKYDKAYPALYSKISPTFTDTKGYFISGFNPSPYGAEFLVFNCTDNLLTVGENGEYLRIQGVALTDDVGATLTVDQYYNKKSDFSNPSFYGSSLTTANLYEDYIDVKNSRLTYGIKAFDLQAPYIQTHDAATEIMGWVISKISKPRKAVGLNTFGTSYAQLGDIVEINYVDENSIGQVSLADSRYVVYSMEYKYSETGPEHVLYLSEVQ
jgi:hypothetical protein